MDLYYDRRGSPIEPAECMRLRRDATYRQVARDQVGESEVSTVWMGGHSLDGARRPLIFETLVIGGELDGQAEQYATESEALAGHADVVQRVRERDPS